MPGMRIILLWYQRMGERAVLYLDRKASPCTAVDLPCVHAALGYICRRLLSLPTDRSVVPVYDPSKQQKKLVSEIQLSRQIQGYEMQKSNVH